MSEFFFAPTASSSGTLQVIQTLTTTGTISNGTTLARLSSAGGAYTATVPSASVVPNQTLVCQKTTADFSVITLSGTGLTTTTLNTIGESVTLVSDGTSWLLIRRDIPSNPTVYTMTIGATTTAPTKGSSLTFDLASWARVGNQILIKYTYLQSGTTGTAAGSGIYLFPLPSGLTIDTTYQVAAANTGVGDVGSAFLRTSATTSTGHVKAYNSTNLSVEVGNEANAPTSVGSGFFAITNADWGISFTAQFAISGWNG